MTDARPYHKVESTIWRQGWDNDTVFLAFYVLTNEHRFTEGLYRLPLEYASAEFKWSAKKVERCFQVLLGADFVDYDENASVVLIVNALKRQQPANDNVAKHAVKKLRTLPPTVLRGRFVGLCEQFAPRLLEQMREGLPEWFTESFAEPFAKPHSSELITHNKTTGLASVPNGSVGSETGLAGRAA